jgi:5'-methylthioadenosine phosphorylase
VGSPRLELGPGALVCARPAGRSDEWARSDLYDVGAVHAPFADPYCPALRAALSKSALDIVDGGAMVVMEGPLFSTRAESQSFAQQGWSLENMTEHCCVEGASLLSVRLREI